MQLTALSRSSLYALAKMGKFPAPVKLSERAVGWLESEISAYINQRAEQRGRGASCK
jgi:prophage regulatory protein